jgi:hypothetical protein
MRFWVLFGTAVALLGADCEKLAQVKLPHLTIEKAEAVRDTFTPPGATAPMRGVPAFCRVMGWIRPTADSNIALEVWLPENWNGRFLGVGNGGFAGAVNYGGLVGGVHAGYATAATDTGHRAGGQDASWALGHPEKIIDFGWRAIHETAVNGKALTRAFYGRAPSKSYFNACSNGGRQALMEAQRFPEDYDGIVAGAPANYWTRLVSLGVYKSKALLAQAESYIPAAKLAAIQELALATCDASDGVKDGVLEEPSRCRPDYGKLLCAGAENDQCLTKAQLTALDVLHGGLRNGKGERLFPAVSIGGEAQAGGWAPWITGAQPERSSMFAFGTQFYKNMVYSDTTWDYRKFDVDRDLQAADEKWAATLNATNADLSKFHARGGKLILYHGWCDAAIPAENTIDYYKSVQQKMGAARTREFVRLFMAPGVQHCAGGAGPDVFGQAGPRGREAAEDVDAAVVAWVEKGVAPERIIASKREPKRTRPLCAYPLVARWKGAGSTDAAENFECVSR